VISIRRFVALALLCVGSVQAATDNFHPDLSSIASIPRYAVDGATMAKALSAARAQKGQPLVFAAGAALPLDLSNGTWTPLEGGVSQWQARVASPGARMLSVNFSQFQLPEGAKLYLYDTAGTLVQGPYTAANETPEGILSTAVVPGDEAVIELRVPTALQSQVQLKLATVYHAFRPLTGSTGSATTKASGITGDTAASCETDVICPAGNNWRSPIQSTGLIQIGSGNELALCSGDLVNNVRQDETPYFLTAHHCMIGTSGFPASSAVVYWNYAASTCGGNNGSLDQSQTGSVLEGTDTGSDFALIKLNQTPSSSFNVYYAGWDASTTDVAQSGVGIHHPEADIKKISTFSTPVSQSTITLTDSSGASIGTVQAWQVTWSSGITEEGSSGSGLWDQNSHIVGVLSGGNSACASSTGTASTGNDYYGRLNVAWTANTAASGQLKAWLDPDNTGTLVCGGKTPGTTSSACSATGSTTGTTTGSTTGSTSSATTPSKSSGGGLISPVLLLLLIPFALRRRRR
jgi:hypothetical protein